jgi:hypothetical protein
MLLSKKDPATASRPDLSERSAGGDAVRKSPEPSGATRALSFASAGRAEKPGVASTKKFGGARDAAEVNTQEVATANITARLIAPYERAAHRAI